MSHFGVKYLNFVVKCLSFIKMPFVSHVQFKVLVNDFALLLRSIVKALPKHDFYKNPRNVI